MTKNSMNDLKKGVADWDNVVLEVVNPLFGCVAVSVLLWLTPDDFTRQWET